MKILNETLDAHIVNPLNENVEADTNLSVKFKQMKTEKGILKAIYQITKPYTGKIYRDDYWEGVRDVIQALKSTGAEVGVFVKDGGYRTNRDGGQYKVYDIDYALHTESGRTFNLNFFITAHQAGTVEDPWAAYDLTLTM